MLSKLFQAFEEVMLLQIEKMGAESAVDVARMVSELRGFERAQALQRAEKPSHAAAVNGNVIPQVSPDASSTGAMWPQRTVE